MDLNVCYAYTLTIWLGVLILGWYMMIRRNNFNSNMLAQQEKKYEYGIGL